MPLLPRGDNRAKYYTGKKRDQTFNGRDCTITLGGGTVVGTGSFQYDISGDIANFTEFARQVGHVDSGESNAEMSIRNNDTDAQGDFIVPEEFRQVIVTAAGSESLVYGTGATPPIGWTQLIVSPIPQLIMKHTNFGVVTYLFEKAIRVTLKINTFSEPLCIVRHCTLRTLGNCPFNQTEDSIGLSFEEIGRQCCNSSSVCKACYSLIVEQVNDKIIDAIICERH